MRQRVYRGTRLQKWSIRLVAFMWTILGVTSLIAILNPVPNSLFQQAFNHSNIAIAIFVTITLGRGLVGLVQPKRYWFWFRAGSFNVAHNSVRGWSLVLAAGAWIACASLTPFSLPDWLIVWGVVSFLWLILPYSVYNSTEVNMQSSSSLNTNLFSDNSYDINPATGMPMHGGTRDTGGCLYGHSSPDD